MVVGAVLGYSGDLDKTIKEPLKNALSKYRDDVRDWNITEITWSPDTANKPLGCCMVKQDGNDASAQEQTSCRELDGNPENSIYYFRGCYTMIKDKIEDNQNVVVGVAIGVVVVMFLNMMFSFAMSTMVK